MIFLLVWFFPGLLIGIIECGDEWVQSTKTFGTEPEATASKIGALCSLFICTLLGPLSVILYFF